MTSNRYYNEKPHRILVEYEHMFRFFKLAHGKKPFPIFKTVEEYYKRCLISNPEILLDKGLNYVKNASYTINKYCENCPDNGVIEFLEKRGNTKYYRMV